MPVRAGLSVDDGDSEETIILLLILLLFPIVFVDSVGNEFVGAPMTRLGKLRTGDIKI